MNGCCNCCQSDVCELFPLAASDGVVHSSLELVCVDCLNLIQWERNTLQFDFSTLVVSPALRLVGLVA